MSVGWDCESLGWMYLEIVEMNGVLHYTGHPVDDVSDVGNDGFLDHGKVMDHDQ